MNLHLGLRTLALLAFVAAATTVIIRYGAASQPSQQAQQGHLQHQEIDHGQT